MTNAKVNVHQPLKERLAALQADKAGSKPRPVHTPVKKRGEPPQASTAYNSVVNGGSDDSCYSSDGGLGVLTVLGLGILSL